MRKAKANRRDFSRTGRKHEKIEIKRNKVPIAQSKKMSRAVKKKRGFRFEMCA